MEGNYARVLSLASSNSNTTLYFVKELVTTVRDAMADCLEVAYPRLSLVDAAKILRVPDVLTYAQEFRPDWTIVDGKELVFQSPDKHLGARDIPSIRLVKETLGYATELDRIV